MLIRIANRFFEIFDLRLRRISTRKQIEEVWRLMVPKIQNYELMRIGPLNDGGYVFPSWTFTPDFVISPGVGGSCAFEIHFAELGVPCLLVDGTVDSPPEKHKNFTFIKMNLGSCLSEHSTTLSEIAAKYDYSEAVLQIDIEGAEFEALSIVPNSEMLRYAVIVIEIHNLFQILDPIVGLKNVQSLLAKISHFHEPIFAKANNIGGSFTNSGINFPNIVEVTFVRKNLLPYLSKSSRKNGINELNFINSEAFKPLSFPQL